MRWDRNNLYFLSFKDQWLPNYQNVNFSHEKTVLSYTFKPPSSYFLDLGDEKQKIFFSGLSIAQKLSLH